MHEKNFTFEIKHGNQNKNAQEEPEISPEEKKQSLKEAIEDAKGGINGLIKLSETLKETMENEKNEKVYSFFKDKLQAFEDMISEMEERMKQDLEELSKL